MAHLEVGEALGTMVVQVEVEVRDLEGVHSLADVEAWVLLLLHLGGITAALTMTTMMIMTGREVIREPQVALPLLVLLRDVEEEQAREVVPPNAPAPTILWAAFLSAPIMGIRS